MADLVVELRNRWVDHEMEGGRRCCWCSVAAATDSEECGSVAAEAPVEARGEIGCGLEGKWSRCLLVIGQDK